MDKKQHNQDDLDLDKALDQFDNQQLNLTGEEPQPHLDQDPQTAAKIKEEYQKFMQDMKGFGLGQGNQDQGLDNLTAMLGGLLQQLTSQTGQEGEAGDIGKGFQQMFKGLQSDNIQDAASKLLNQFMNKDLLYEPIVQAKQHYDEYFKKQEGKIPKEDEQRYKKQYALLSEIITTLESSPQQKQKLIGLFEKMQELGHPPQGIASTAAFM